MSSTRDPTIAHFKGGRHPNKRSTDEENPAPAVSFDDDLPEGVDFSEGGWATDFAASLLGLLFFISGLVHYNNDTQHVLYLQAGTAVAHFFGGLAHRYFPNRAADGVGMTGFYVTMVLGYGGNCLRFALGWDLKGAYWPVLGIAAFCYLAITATWTVYRMERTSEKIDQAAGAGFKPDSIYATGELLVAILEVTAGVVFLVEHEIARDNYFAIAAVAANIAGWFVVYAVGGIAFLAGIDYNPGMMQRLFHFAMMIMLWAMNEYALEESDK